MKHYQYFKEPLRPISGLRGFLLCFCKGEEMQSSTSPIIIQDYPCGSGKTSRMLEGFKPNSKYLVVVPYLSEVQRVLEGSKVVLFKQPLAEETSYGRKTDNLEELLISGENIVTTHRLYGSIVKMARQGLLWLGVAPLVTGLVG